MISRRCTCAKPDGLHTYTITMDNASIGWHCTKCDAITMEFEWPRDQAGKIDYIRLWDMASVKGTLRLPNMGNLGV